MKKFHFINDISNSVFTLKQYLHTGYLYLLGMLCIDVMKLISSLKKHVTSGENGSARFLEGSYADVLVIITIFKRESPASSITQR